MASNKTLVHAVLRQLEEGILSGALPPGERLDEQKLAIGFGASRTPVREALRHLAAAGLVETRPRKGAVVAKVSIPGMIQMFEVRAVLEGTCARLAARRMTTAERERLAAAHRECGSAVRSGDPEQYFAANRAFHDLIYVGAHNPFLEETTRGIRNRASAYRRRQLRQPGRLAASFREHEAILAAILDGNCELADDLMRRHITMQGEDFVDFLSSLTVAEVMAGNWR